MITSTNRAAEHLGPPVPVDVFDPDTALRFLRQATGLDDEDGALTVATELGFLPLGLAQAAARIRAGWDYPTYLDRLRRYTVDRYLTRRPGDPYPMGAPAAILIALDPFYANEPSHASHLLETLALFSPDGISHDLLTALGSNPAVLDDDLERLYDASIVEFAGNGMDGRPAVTMHRLVQRIIRDRCKHAGTYQRLLSGHAEWLESLTFAESEAWRLRRRGNELIRHIEALWNNATHHSEAHDLNDILSLRAWGVWHLVKTEALARAIPLAQRVLRAVHAYFGADHPSALVSANNLANAYSSAGRLAEAIELFEQTLPDHQRMLGPDDPTCLILSNNLALAYKSAGRVAEAVRLFEQTLTKARRVLGPDHPTTLNSANNLAYAYQSARRVAEAIPIFEQTLADRRRVLGEDHSDTLISASNLASAYESMGRVADAISMFEQTHTKARHALGDDHPRTFIPALNLAHAYESAGRLAEAIRLIEQTLADMRQVLGHDHPHTLTSAANLASAYCSAGRLAEAIPIFERTLADRRRVLGEDHPDAFASAANLARVYCSSGQVAEAIVLYQQILTDMRRVLGTRSSGRWPTVWPTRTDRRAGCLTLSRSTSRPSPTVGGYWATATPTPSSRLAISALPIGRRVDRPTLSRCSSRILYSSYESLNKGPVDRQHPSEP